MIRLLENFGEFNLLADSLAKRPAPEIEMRPGNTHRPLLAAGEWQGGEESFEVRSPYTGEKLADVASAGEAVLGESVAAAAAAAERMKALPRFRIASGLRKIAEGISDRAEEFTSVITSYSIHYTKLYEILRRGLKCLRRSF